MVDWIASLGRGLTMVILPIAAFGVGVVSVDWHDDSLRKAVISKNWSSTTVAAHDDKSEADKDEKPAEGKGDKPKDAQGKASEFDNKDDDG